jgi:hypothetical protein
MHNRRALHWRRHFHLSGRETRKRHGARRLQLLPIGRHLCALLPLAFCCVAGATDAIKILRVASPDIDTLDPQQFSDDPSFQVLMAVYEPLYEWDYLASPPRLSPLTATGPPAITDDGKTWTTHLKPGIFFTADPAFKGNPRELVAEDYVYRGLRLFVQAVAGPQSSPGRLPDNDRPDRRHAIRCRRRAQERQVRLRSANRGPACARSLYAAAQARRAELPDHS